MKVYRISVRTLVEFVLRRGDLTSGGFASTARAQEGTRLHQKLQKNAGQDYQKEVPFQEEVMLAPELQLIVEGRADGIYREDGTLWTVDEIKSTTTDPALREDGDPLHWAQAACYGWMLYCAQQRSEELLPPTQVQLRLSYIYTETEEVRYFFRILSVQELKSFWDELIEGYKPWLLWQEAWRAERNKTAAGLEFPFERFRSGQRAMAAYVYQAIRESERLFLQAPTGIGKTLSVLFPAVKAMGREMGEKIFYLTAKNVTAQAPADALQQLRKGGLHCKSVVITAKDKICPQTERRCTPEACPRARGHFDRVNGAVYAALQADEHFDKETILNWAERFEVCPFEFSLDLAVWADVVICDYNYAFDPSASLKRFFQGRGDYIILTDEAHNLVDRSREMFSAGLSREEFRQARRTVSKEKDPYLYRSLDRIGRLFAGRGRELGETDFERQDEPAEGWHRALQRFTERAEAYLQKGESADELLELYFKTLFFLRVWDGASEGYEYYEQKKGKDLLLRFFCINPAQQLQQTYDQVRSVIFFSATLTPADYYKTLLGGREQDKAIALPSPFDPQRQCVLIGGLDVSYQQRESSAEAACDWIARTVQAKPGHYMVFFPSFAYLQQMEDCFRERYPEFPILCQESSMTEEDKQAFLAGFEGEQPVLGFVVLGGAFSEGIDLRGDHLIGTIILSVGLPQLGRERDLIREHMEKETGRGFEYAYMFPGMGRVLQAAGRVIRTEADRGVIVLLDRRFTQERYRRLYPAWWRPQTIHLKNIETVLQDFWNGAPE